MQSCERKNDFCSSQIFSGAYHAFSNRNMTEEAQAKELDDWRAKIDLLEPVAEDKPQPQKPRRGAKSPRQ